jgi:glyceraldehyde 3-phosphate dehydrogenase
MVDSRAVGGLDCRPASNTMTTVHFAINGLGRVGRALLRLTRDRPELQLVALNDQADPGALARLVAHDSLHGRFPGTVAASPEGLVVDGRTIPLFREADPARIPWPATGATVVVEATGQFRTRALAAAHLGGSVRRVVVSATAEGADATFCFGVNHESFDPARHHVVSNASCTTNCLAPVLLVLDREFGIEQALIDTVHCYTNSQRLMDMAHLDPRRARAAALNIIPTTSDAVGALPLVLPDLAGKLAGLAFRVPVPNGSLVDVTATLSRPTTADALRNAFRAAASGPLGRILAVTEEELVSVDFIGDPHSATVDLPLLEVVGGRLARVVAWYDNEWGYANRLADLLLHLGTTCNEEPLSCPS